MTEPSARHKDPGRVERRPAGTASRFVVAGAAAGAGLAMVGAMAAAADRGSAGPADTAVTDRIVVPDATTQMPGQIVIVIPGLDPATAGPEASSVILAEPTVVAPARAEPLTPVPSRAAPPPVVESGGS